MSLEEYCRKCDSFYWDLICKCQVTPTPRYELDQYLKGTEMELINQIENIEKKAEMIAKSSIIPSSLRGKSGDILVLLMMAQELDIPPMQAINGINVIQGKPTISPQLMLGLIRRRVPSCYIKIEPSQEKLSCTVTMARDISRMDEAYTTTWDMERAKKLQLDKKDNYIKQPLTMLQWRAVGDAARQIFSDVLSGLYFPDELDHLNDLHIDEKGELQGPKEVEVKSIKAEKSLDQKIFDVMNEIINDPNPNFSKEKIKEDLIEKYGDASTRKALSIERKNQILNELIISNDGNKK